MQCLPSKPRVAKSLLSSPWEPRTFWDLQGLPNVSLSPGKESKVPVSLASVSPGYTTDASPLKNHSLAVFPSLQNIWGLFPGGAASSMDWRVVQSGIAMAVPQFP